MPQLDDETLKELGRFAIEFNSFADLINSLATDIIECTEGGIARNLTESLTEGRKLERIKEACDILAKAHGLQDSDLHKALLEQIALAKGISTERNTVIHVIFQDLSTT